MTQSTTLPRRFLPWLEELGLSIASIVPLTGDVSPRRYYRIRLADGRGSRIVAHYPPELRSAYRTAAVSTELLEQAGIPIARILARDDLEELALLEDLGANSLFSIAVGSGRARALYRQAVSLLGKIGDLDAAVVGRLNPSLDRDLLQGELEQTWRLYLGPRLETTGTGTSSFGRDLWAALEELCRQLAKGPRTPCHRDFMSRNLMVLGGDRLAVIDHQDLRLGPRHYDLASLLNDSVRLRPSQTERLAREAGVAELLDYRRAAAQRCLKIVGTFLAFAERGSPRYLAMVSPTLERALDHLGQIPETSPLLPSLRKTLRHAREGSAL